MAIPVGVCVWGGGVGGDAWIQMTGALVLKLFGNLEYW